MANCEVPSVVLLKGLSSTLKSETASFLLQELAKTNTPSAFVDNGLHCRAYTHGVTEFGGINGHVPTFEEIGVNHEWEDKGGYFGNSFKHNGKRLDAVWLNGYQISSKVSEIASHKLVQGIIKAQICSEVHELKPQIAVVVGRSSAFLDIPPAVSLYFSSPRDERIKRRQRDFNTNEEERTVYSYEEVRDLLEKRDRMDRQRENDPLKLEGNDIVVRFIDTSPRELAVQATRMIYQCLDNPSQQHPRRIRV